MQSKAHYSVNCGDPRDVGARNYAIVYSQEITTR